MRQSGQISTLAYISPSILSVAVLCLQVSHSSPIFSDHSVSRTTTSFPAMSLREIFIAGL